MATFIPNGSSDSYYYGFWGLDKLYRVCRDDEEIEDYIYCKAERDTFEWNYRTVEQHIKSGSENGSRYISTTTSPDVALRWAFFTMENKNNIEERVIPRRIIEIDLAKIPPETARGMINLTVEEVRNHFLRGATQICRVKASQEVLFQDHIPKLNWKTDEIVYRLWENPPKPQKPKSKSRRPLVTDQHLEDKEETALTLLKHTTINIQ